MATTLKRPANLPLTSEHASRPKRLKRTDSNEVGVEQWSSSIAGSSRPATPTDAAACLSPSIQVVDFASVDATNPHEEAAPAAEVTPAVPAPPPEPKLVYGIYRLSSPLPTVEEEQQQQQQQAANGTTASQQTPQPLVCVDTTTDEEKHYKILSRERHQQLLRTIARLQHPLDQRAATLARFRFNSFEEGDDGARVLSQLFPAGSALVPVGDHTGRVLLVQDAHYGDLHAFVRNAKGGLPEKQARDLYLQIVEMVAYCHERGVVLRDLKLRKFVFGDEKMKTLRLDSLDDAVVFDYDSEDWLTERHGCPAYVSPELLTPGKPRFGGKAADVWSLGVLLFVMLLGRYPFYDTTPFGLFAKIRSATVVIPAERPVSGGTKEKLSYELLVLLRCILRRAPAERPTAIGLLSTPWLSAERARAARWVGKSVCCPTTAVAEQKRCTACPNALDQVVPQFVPSSRQ